MAATKGSGGTNKKSMVSSGTYSDIAKTRPGAQSKGPKGPQMKPTNPPRKR